MAPPSTTIPTPSASCSVSASPMPTPLPNASASTSRASASDAPASTSSEARSETSNVWWNKSVLLTHGRLNARLTCPQSKRGRITTPSATYPASTPATTRNPTPSAPNTTTSSPRGVVANCYSVDVAPKSSCGGVKGTLSDAIADDLRLSTSAVRPVFRASRDRQALLHCCRDHLSSESEPGRNRDTPPCRCAPSRQ